ncbi:MAG: ferrous iron transport protein B [Kiritimatiellia bacterium]
MAKRTLTAALIGDPNTGKSTFFNAWTGMHQVTGNWPGVTVEKLLGNLTLPTGERLTIVDLPGIYSLHAVSEDEKVATEFVRKGKIDLIINIVDAVNLDRNLYLTLALMELGIPMVMVLSMTDILERQGFRVNKSALSERLGIPVVLANVQKKSKRAALERAILEALSTRQQQIKVLYPAALQQPLIEAKREGEPAVFAIHRLEGILPGAEALIASVEKEQGTTPDVLIADARYNTIATLTKEIVNQVGHARTEVGRTLDKIALNRWLGIPLFLVMMYLLFWLTQFVGGCFIEFFDHVGEALFVTGTAQLLTLLHSPSWLITLLAEGLGTGIQTVMTFIPPVFFIFFGLSLLEDSGYMARAAYVMDRFMRFLGLPGSAFVPMLVGFGCTVPAIMATRTLANRRDRLLTIFMVPFMSCGARLPVYALFGAAFFGAASGTMVFAIYLCGIVLAVATGLLLKHTLFVGTPAPFVMELPLYHIPHLSSVLKQAWDRLQRFIFRAGKVVVIMVLFLSACDKIHLTTSDATGNAVPTSLLEVAGRKLTPVFAPMGIKGDNWQGSVALIVGLFAKEQVVSSLNSLYAIGNSNSSAPTIVAPTSEETEGHVWEKIQAGLQSVPVNLAALCDRLCAPFGITFFTPQEVSMSNHETDATLMKTLAEKFDNDKHRAFAYLLFVLLYVPCLAAMATIVREVGGFYSTILLCYLTALGWCVATLYFQITSGHQLLWIIIPCLFLLAIVLFFSLLGRRMKIKLVL